MISCGQPFYITPAEVDEIEFSGMTDSFELGINPTPEQSKIIKAKKESGALNNIALQIKDLIDIHDKCKAAKDA